VGELRRSHCRDRVDPAWREIATDLAQALRPYTLLCLRVAVAHAFRLVFALRIEDGVDNDSHRRAVMPPSVA
jgi:hypothetical protein